MDFNKQNISACYNFMGLVTNELIIYLLAVSKYTAWNYTKCKIKVHVPVTSFLESLSFDALLDVLKETAHYGLWTYPVQESPGMNGKSKLYYVYADL